MHLRLGFPAILKQAPQDFQVHEIEPQGQELHLSELLGPPEVSFAMEGGWHLHFRLYKEGLDTMDAIARMARCLGRSRRGFRFAGTKDRNAVSVQRVSCSQLEPEALRAAVLHPEWDHRIRFSDLEIRPHEIDLGDLAGNRFNAVLRGVPPEAFEGETSTVARCCQSVSERGFVNYFGPQRFGSQMIRSFHVGSAILERRFDDAVRLILGDASSLGSEVSKVVAAAAEIAAARSRYFARAAANGMGSLMTDAAAEAERMMPSCRMLERGLLRSLASGLSAEEALLRMPRQGLMLYVKSAQSLLFNEVLSFRLLGSV
ncbi:unnamed protein product [Polarella glacialis]|uniref:TRUD domain-containing protein n=1 Tax=Polarella glacialis TaxID=89957 RepID=A0A813H6M4_POLGL|nr:unnamed protein product [Polarella glacialis]CAE8720691.1 unnamed protein product [Polarella glacialis]